MIRASAVFCSLLLAASMARAQAAPQLLERARASDARTEYRAAARGYEAYATRCLALQTAVLASCEHVPEALSRAFELSVASDDASAAARLGATFAAHFLYARPREAMRIGYALAKMHVDAARFDAAEEALERWIELHPDAPAGRLILVDAMRARIAHGTGREARARRLWRRVERRFRSARLELAAVPVDLIRDAVAEARLLRAEPDVQRFLATRPPAARGRRDAREWWTRVITPWRVRTERRLLLARMELERVYALGSPRHSVVAAARIGAMYAHLAELHASMPPAQNEWIRVLLTRGEHLPGYDEALSHFETCARWADHHRVARRWGARCEARLHELDPARYPLPAELAGGPGYLPRAVALPGAPPR